jgi:hypothetical protein
VTYDGRTGSGESLNNESLNNRIHPLNTPYTTSNNLLNRWRVVCDVCKPLNVRFSNQGSRPGGWGAGGVGGKGAGGGGVRVCGGQESPHSTPAGEGEGDISILVG